jgi:hypothetical protein
VRVVVTPVRAPNANAYAERFVRSIREEYLERLVLLGERRLHRTLKEFLVHYHGERNHQGLGNRLIAPDVAERVGARVRCLKRLGGVRRLLPPRRLSSRITFRTLRLGDGQDQTKNWKAQIQSIACSGRSVAARV